MKLRCALLLGLMSLVVGASDHAPRFDLIVRGGTVIDGSGHPRFRADIGIIDGHIAAIGALHDETAERSIEAGGQIVAPGFINIHDHAIAGAIPTAENMLSQGVTTEIMNADGLGPADIAAQLADIESRGAALNFGAQIGFNAVWKSVMGDAARRPNPAEITEMRARLVRAMMAGAWGVSAGLDFAPLSAAHPDDVVAVLSVVRPWRTTFANHERLSNANGYSSLAGIAETIELAARAGTLPVVTHIKLQGKEQGQTGKLLALLADWRKRGVEVVADIYPYTAGQTGLADLLVPAWGQEGGRAKMLARFRNPDLRGDIATSIETTMSARFGGATGIFVLADRSELTALMAHDNVSAGEAVIRALEREATPAILRFGREDDVEVLIQQPGVAIACDCGATLETNLHPRAYGTFPRVLGHFARDRKIMTLENAVASMTSLPARISGIADRGLLRVGMAADLTIFDPATISDRATFAEPARQALGVNIVIVNGQVAWQNGARTKALGGQALRRSPVMQSAAPGEMGADVSPRLTGRLAGRKIAVQIKLASPGRTPGLQIAGVDDVPAFRATSIGVLHRWTDGLGMIGWGRDRHGRTGPFMFLLRRNAATCSNDYDGSLTFSGDTTSFGLNFPAPASASPSTTEAGTCTPAFDQIQPVDAKS